MARVVLHIGTHKTGTTAVQNLFWRRAKELSNLGCYYPRLPYRHTGHHGLVTDWGTHLPPTYRLKAGSRATIADLSRQFANREGVVLLSSEEISRADPSQRVDLAELRSLLSGFEAVTVVCVLRPQWQLLQSLYAEVSRRRSPPRPPDMVAQALETVRCDGLFLNYFALYSWLREAFDPTEIHLIDYNEAKHSAQGVAGAILTKAGLSVPDGFEDQADLSANVSPAPLVQWMANLLSEPDPASAELLKWLNGQFQNHPSQCLFSRGELQRLRDGFSASNAALAKATGLTLCDPDLPKDTLFREDVQLEFWKNVARNLRAAAGL